MRQKFRLTKKIQFHDFLPFNCVSADVEDAVLALLGDLLDGGHRGAVEVAVVLAGLDEFVVLYVGLHGLAGLDEVVVAAVDLELSARSGGVGNTGSESVGVL